MNSKRGPSNTGRNNAGDLSEKNTLSNISKTSPKGDGSISSRGGFGLNADAAKAANNGMLIQNELHTSGEFLSLPDKKGQKT